jgi:hypothetical protein
MPNDLRWKEHSNECHAAHPYRVWCNRSLGFSQCNVYHLGRFIGSAGALKEAKEIAEKHVEQKPEDHPVG